MQRRLRDQAETIRRDQTERTVRKLDSEGNLTPVERTIGQPTDIEQSAVDRVVDVVGVVAEAQTYKNLLHLFLLFPLGILYYMLLVVGFTLGLGLAVLVVWGFYW